MSYMTHKRTTFVLSFTKIEKVKQVKKVVKVKKGEKVGNVEKGKKVLKV